MGRIDRVLSIRPIWFMKPLHHFRHTDNGRAFTDLIVEIFRTNADLLAAGNELMAPFGVTSARWQVLGIISSLEQKLTVSEIARALQLTRQSVQRIVNDLIKLELLKLLNNPADQRAKHVALTQKGADLLEQVRKAQAEWANELSRQITLRDIQNSIQLMRDVSSRLRSPSKVMHESLINSTEERPTPRCSNK